MTNTNVNPLYCATSELRDADKTPMDTSQVYITPSGCVKKFGGTQSSWCRWFSEGKVGTVWVRANKYYAVQSVVEAYAKTVVFAPKRGPRTSV